MAGSEPGSTELRDVLDRFYALSTKGQLELFAEACEHLGSAAWAEDEVEREIDKRAEALKALETVAAELRDRGEFREGKSPTVVELNATAKRLGLDISSAVVIGAFIRWGIAKTVLKGGQAREKPSRKRARVAAVGRRRTHEDHLAAVRLWLETRPTKLTTSDYDAFVKEANRKKENAERPLPGAEAVTTGLRVGWPTVLRVARGEVGLDDAPGRWGAVLAGDEEATKPALVLVAVGERLPAQRWKPSVYEIAHRRLNE
jgi:hypothetical protein